MRSSRDAGMLTMRHSQYLAVVALWAALFGLTCTDDSGNPANPGGSIPPPTDLVAVAQSDTAIHITWTYGSAQVSEFSVERSIGSAQYVPASSVTNSGRSYLDVLPLLAGQTYQYRVVARVGESSSSYALSNTVLVTLLPPSAVIASTAADTAMVVFWAHPGGFQTHFGIERSVGMGSYDSVGIAGASSWQFLDRTVPIAGQTYTYRVRALSRYNVSAYATSPPINIVFASPEAVTVEVRGDTAAQVGWTYTGALQTGFEVERQTGPGDFVPVGTVGPAAREILDETPLRVGETYSYRVRTTSRSSKSEYATGAPFSIEFVAPSLNSLVARGDTAVQLSWTYTNGFQAGFRIECQTGLGEFDSVSVVAANTRQFVRSTPLLSEQTYIYRVCAISRYNQSGFATSGPLNVVLTKPSAVTVAVGPDSSLRVGWDYSASFQTGFEVERQIGLGGYEAIGIVGAAARQYFDRTWQNGQSNRYRVRALSRYNESAFASDSNSTIIPVAWMGKIYTVVQIGVQRWLKENLDVGTSGFGQTDNGAIEKYCYNNDTANCRIYGGLYVWDEAMQWSASPGARGICPPGFHIPTREDFNTLSAEVGGHADALKAVSIGGNANSSGFSLLFGGIYFIDYEMSSPAYMHLGYAGLLWSSTTYEDSRPVVFGLSFDSDTIGIGVAGIGYKVNAYSVRCVGD